MIELTAAFCFKDSAKRFVYGAVLVPGEKDLDGDVVSIDKVEELCHEFAYKYRNIDVQHSRTLVGKMLENHIQRQDWTVTQGDDSFLIPSGSWMMGVKVENDATWQAVEKGELTGFSIMGVPKAIFEKANGDTEVIMKSQRKITLRDLAEFGDWVVTYVSLVDQPAVPKAKFVVIKKANGFIPGSHEHIRFLLQQRLTEKGRAEHNLGEFGWVDIRSVSDKDVAYGYSIDGEQLYQHTYSYNSSIKEIALEGEETKVDIEARIIADVSDEVRKSIFEITLNAVKEIFRVSKQEDIKSQSEENDMTKEETQALIVESLQPLMTRLEEISDKANKAFDAIMKPILEVEPERKVIEPQTTVDEAVLLKEAIDAIESIESALVVRNGNPLHLNRSKSLKSALETQEEKPTRIFDEHRDMIGRRLAS